MGRQAGDRSRQDADRLTPVGVADAARALGISPDAVRGRIRRGTLDAEKVGGRWLVYLDRQDTDRPRQDTATGDAGELAAMRRYVERLELELDQRNAELRSMHLQVERLSRALPPPAPDADERAAGGLAAWWRRLRGDV